MAKKQLTIEEKLQAALVPAEEQPYKVPENWCWVYLLAGYAECLDKYRKPVNAKERAERIGEIPYYGATGQVGWIDDYLTDEQLVLLGEDGAPFLDLYKDKAYMIEGKAWVNNHAHILRSFWGRNGNELLVHYLNQFNFNGYVNGTTRLKLTQASMNVIPMVLPPRAEQSRIVARIESLFAKLDEAKEKIQEVLDGADLRRAAILHQAFTGKLTEKWRKENGVADKWIETSSAKLFEYVTSGSRGWAQYYSSDGAIFLRMGNLNHGTIDLDLNDIQYVSLPDKTEGQRSRVKKGDILISITADVGMVACIKTDMEEAYINQHVALARPVEGVYSEFIAWYFVSDVGLKQLQNMQRGATKVGLTLKDIKSVKLKMPQIEEQKEIVRLLDNLLSREQSTVTACEEALTTIDTLKKSILARAFRGELGTNDPSEVSAKELLQEILAS